MQHERAAPEPEPEPLTPGGLARHRYDLSAGLTFVLVATAVAGCVLWIDRPLALWADGHVTGTAAYALAGALLRPLDAVGITGFLLLLVAAAWTRASAPSPTWVRRFLVAALAAILSLVVTVVLKLAIGRTQVYPTFLQQGRHAFRPFGGYPAYAAFPSATMSTAGAFLAGLGIRGRPGHAAAALVLAVLALALLATSSHWASDILAGLYLGLLVGSAVRRYAERRPAPAPAPVPAPPT